MGRWFFSVMGKSRRKQKCSERQECSPGSSGLDSDPDESIDGAATQSMDAARSDVCSDKRTNFHEYVLAVACMVATCLYVSRFSTALEFRGVVAEALTRANILTEYPITTVSPLLQVFQVYPPVLTAVPGAGLEIADGSPNTTVALANNSISSCEETLIVHSFSNSYGRPFVGSCQRNSARVSLAVH